MIAIPKESDGSNPYSLEVGKILGKDNHSVFPPPEEKEKQKTTLNENMKADMHARPRVSECS